MKSLVKRIAAWRPEPLIPPPIDVDSPLYSGDSTSTLHRTPSLTSSSGSSQRDVSTPEIERTSSRRNAARIAKLTPLNTPVLTTFKRCGHHHLLVPYGREHSGPSLSSATPLPRREEARRELSHLRTFTTHIMAFMPEEAQERLFPMFAPLQALDANLNDDALGKKGRFFDNDLCVRLTWLQHFVHQAQHDFFGTQALLRASAVLSGYTFAPETIASATGVFAMLCTLPGDTSHKLLAPGVKLRFERGDTCLMFAADDLLQLAEMPLQRIHPTVRRFIFAVPQPIFTTPLLQSDLRARARVALNVGILPQDRQWDLYEAAHRLTECVAEIDEPYYRGEASTIILARLRNTWFTTLEVLARRTKPSQDISRLDAVVGMLYGRDIRAPVPLAQMLDILLDISPILWPQLFFNMAHSLAIATRNASTQVMLYRPDLQETYAAYALKGLRREADDVLARTRS